MSNPLSPPPELNITVPRRGRRPGPCPCCGSRGGLCDSHRERLRSIRDDVERETFNLTRDGARAKSPQTPMCNTKGCWNPRTPPSGFCHDCIEDSE